MDMEEPVNNISPCDKVAAFDIQKISQFVANEDSLNELKKQHRRFSHEVFSDRSPLDTRRQPLLQATKKHEARKQILKHKEQQREAEFKNQQHENEQLFAKNANDLELQKKTLRENFSKVQSPFPQDIPQIDGEIKKTVIQGIQIAEKQWENFKKEIENGL